MSDENKDPEWDLSRIEYTGDDKSEQPKRDFEDADDNKNSEG